MTAYCRLPVTIRGGPIPTTGNHPRRPSAGFRSPCHNGPTADYRQPSETVQRGLPVTVRWRPHCRLPATFRDGPVPASGHRPIAAQCRLRGTVRVWPRAGFRPQGTVRRRPTAEIRLPDTGYRRMQNPSVIHGSCSPSMFESKHRQPFILLEMTTCVKTIL